MVVNTSSEAGKANTSLYAEMVAEQILEVGANEATTSLQKTC